MGTKVEGQGMNKSGFENGNNRLRFQPDDIFLLLLHSHFCLCISFSICLLIKSFKTCYFCETRPRVTIHNKAGLLLDNLLYILFGIFAWLCIHFQLSNHAVCFLCSIPYTNAYIHSMTTKYKL